MSWGSKYQNRRLEQAWDCGSFCEHYGLHYRKIQLAMTSKYDTNPLDPEFPERVKAEAEAVAATQVLGHTGTETRKFVPSAPTAASEEQTRRFASPDLHAYQAPFNGQHVPAVYQSAMASPADETIYRKVQKIGLPENVLIAVPYIPWFLGMVAGILLLLLVPKSETKVRFHAAQGLAAHVGILIVTSILGIIGNVADVAEIGNGIFTLVTSIMLVIFAIKAWKGKPVHIESIEDLTNWLDEKISPKLS